MRRQWIISYLIEVMIALLCMAALWTVLVSGRFYVCTDSMPLTDFIPPFIHPSADPGDHYVASPALIWSLWAVFIAAGLFTPLIFRRRYDQTNATSKI